MLLLSDENQETKQQHVSCFLVVVMLTTIEITNLTEHITMRSKTEVTTSNHFDQSTID